MISKSYTVSNIVGHFDNHITIINEQNENRTNIHSYSHQQKTDFKAWSHSVMRYIQRAWTEIMKF
jgi:maltodextrin utilization protein YvdJ